MSERGFSARQNEPLIGVILGEELDRHVLYFTEEPEVDQVAAEDGAHLVQDLAGVWRDLDWGQIELNLSSIRHDSPPSAPLDL